VQCTGNPPDVRFPNCTAKLLGEDGNAFAILGKVRRVLNRHLRYDLGWDAARAAVEVERYTNEAKAGDYGHLLRTTMEWVEVQ
jgi:hypothetical protein